MVFPAKAKVQGKAVAKAPVILEVKAPDSRAVAPGVALESEGDIVGQAQHEIGLANKSSQRVESVLRGEASAEVDASGAAAVAGVERVDPLPQDIPAHLHHVASADESEVIGDMPGSVVEKLLEADVAAAQAMDPIEASAVSESPAYQEQAGAGILDADRLRQVAEAFVLPAVPLIYIVDAEAEF